MLQFLLIIIHVHHNIYTIYFIPKDSIRVIWSVIQCKMYKCTLYSACTYINLHPLYYIPIIYSYTLTHISAFWRTYINIIYIYIYYYNTAISYILIYYIYIPLLDSWCSIELYSWAIIKWTNLLKALWLNID